MNQERADNNRSRGFPLERIILVKGRDCFCYKLGSRADRLPELQPLVLMDKKKSIVLRAIDDTDIALCLFSPQAKNRRSTRVRTTHSRRT